MREVESGGTLKARYTWLADGSKLRVRDAASNGFDYLGSLTYTGSGAGLRLEAANFGGGSIKVSGTSQEINYLLTDHLGSTRVIVDGLGVVKERNDYYAFGAKHVRSDYPQTTNRYDFNGKEDQTTGALNLLDYGARMYDPALGRWFNVDLLAEDYFDLSPFNYCTNNPIAFVDPNGMFATKFGAWWYNLWHGGNGIGRDSAGEWFAFSFVDGYVDDDGAINLIYDKTFDRGGRPTGIDLNYQRLAELKIQQLEMLKTLSDCGIEAYLTDDIDEARKSWINVGLSAVLPSPILKSATGAANIAKTTTIATKVTKTGKNWVYGAFKSNAKWARQMAQRGWTEKQITEAITKGNRFKTINNVNKANGATKYVHPSTGRYVVVDDVTKELLQVGGDGFKL